MKDAVENLESQLIANIISILLSPTFHNHKYYKIETNHHKAGLKTPSRTILVISWFNSSLLLVVMLMIT